MNMDKVLMCFVLFAKYVVKGFPLRAVRGLLLSSAALQIIEQAQLLVRRSARSRTLRRAPATTPAPNATPTDIPGLLRSAARASSNPASTCVSNSSYVPLTIFVALLAKSRPLSVAP